jgi:hypothetical protein
MPPWFLGLVAPPEQTRRVNYRSSLTQRTAVTGEQLAVPAFGLTRQWLNTEQLDQLDTMTNRTLELARQAFGR